MEKEKRKREISARGRQPGVLVRALLASLLLVASVSRAQSRLDLSGLATLTASSDAEGALEAEEVVGRVHFGIDWYPTAILSFHVSLQARTDEGESREGAAGVTEAYADAAFVAGSSRFRLRAGAFFLPTSFENTEPFWQSPYALSSSALNTWIGEELRPVGVDASYAVGGFRLGATVYRGNETLGALPPVRGWRIGDRWSLLGEKVPVDGSVFTSLIAENDGELGWAGRVGWSAEHFEVQGTHYDNRSDGLLYGDLYNWNTVFDQFGFGLYAGNWTLLAEKGWGPTYLVVEGEELTSDIYAGYVLLSRQIGTQRLTLRYDAWNDGDELEGGDEALTLAYLARVRGRYRLGVEATGTEDQERIAAQLRIAFGSASR